MYYLILDAEYLSTGIKSPTQGYLQQEDLRVSYQLWNEIIEWREDYAAIILMPPNKKQKSSSLKKIDELDKRGEMLIKKLLDELTFNVKIQYYSEGMLSYLSYYEENSSFFFNFFRKPKTY